MKRIISTTALIFAITVSLFSAKFISAGNFFSPAGKYRIEASENKVKVNGKMLEAFRIIYENSDLTVTIAVEKQKKCKKFYVLSDNLSVQYVAGDKYFGVEMLDRDLASLGYTTISESMNVEEYFKQKVIADADKDDIEFFNLIATFYPSLIKVTNKQFSV